MTNDPDYRAIQPDPTKPKTDYNWAERRADLYKMIQKVGHYQALYARASTRELGARYGVSHTTIRRDISAINEWQAENLGDHAEHELETLKNAAIESYIADENHEKAYYLMKNHYELLMEAGLKEKAADELELSGDGFEVDINHVPATEILDDGDDYDADAETDPGEPTPSDETPETDDESEPSS